MMKSLLGVCCLLVVTPAVSDQTSHSLATHPWGRWQTGAWVKTETSSAGQRPLVERYQLTKIGREKYEIDSVLETTGGDVGTKIQRAWAFGGFAQHVADAKVVGSENVVVAGRRFPCEIWEARTEYQGQPMVDRTWMAAGIDLPLRIKTSGADGNVDLTATKLDDYVRIAGRKLRCVRYVGSGKARRSAFQMVQWVSLDVPGGVVRLDTTAQQNGTKSTFRREVVEFRGEARSLAR